MASCVVGLGCRWELLGEILKDESLTRDIVCDIGLPVEYGNVRYNCRAFVLNSRILLVRGSLRPLTNSSVFSLSNCCILQLVGRSLALPYSCGHRPVPGWLPPPWVRSWS
jgi:hypothetical protein